MSDHSTGASSSVGAEWVPAELEDGESLLYNSENEVEDADANAEDVADAMLELAIGNPAEPPIPQEIGLSTYLDDICAGSELYIKNRRQVQIVYEKEGLYGLFSLFVTPLFKNHIMEWTNNRLHKAGHPLLTMAELDAWIGLQLAMSIVPLANMRDFWKDDPLLGQEFFKALMPWDRFLKIRAKLAVHNCMDISMFQKAKDPFWDFRFMMRHFQERFTKTAEAYGNTALDEMGVRFSGRHRGVTYAPQKPEKFVFQFYAEAHYESLYVTQIQSNDSGVYPKNAPAKYLQIYPKLQGPLQKVVDWMTSIGSTIDMKSASTLWMAMICQPYVEKPECPHLKSKLVIVDNFYTRHMLGLGVDRLSMGRVKLLGTIKTNLICSHSKKLVQKMSKTIADLKRGSWCMVKCYQQETAEMSKAGKFKKLKDPKLVPSQNAAFILFKDKKVCQFYTNALTGTMSEDFLMGDAHEAHVLVHGLAPIRRWTQESVGGRSVLMVPRLVAHYNKYMCAVDRVDLHRSMCATQRQEKRGIMAFFTFCLNLSVLNARALQRALDNLQIPENRKAKQSIVVRLVAQHIRNRMSNSIASLDEPLPPPAAAIRQNQPADNNIKPQEDEAAQIETDKESLDLQGKDQFNHHHFLVKNPA